MSRLFDFGVALSKAQALNASDALEPEALAFSWFADAHPHEAYAMEPEKFIAYVQSKVPGITREQIIANLAATENAGE